MRQLRNPRRNPNSNKSLDSTSISLKVSSYGCGNLAGVLHHNGEGSKVAKNITRNRKNIGRSEVVDILNSVDSSLKDARIHNQRSGSDEADESKEK